MTFVKIVPVDTGENPHRCRKIWHTSQMGKKLIRFLLGLVITLAVLGGLAEFGARYYLGQQFTKQFAATDTDAQPEIHFGKQSLVLGLLQNDVPEIDFTIPDSLTIQPGNPPVVGGTPASHVVLRHLQINPTNGEGTARDLQVTTTLSTDFLLAQAQQAMQQATGGNDANDLASLLISNLLKITDITTSPQEQTVELEFTNAAGTLTLKPTVLGGKLTFAVVGANLLGIDLPEQFVSVLSEKFASQEMASMDMVFERVDIGADGITLEMHGHNVDLGKMGEIGQLSPAGN